MKLGVIRAWEGRYGGLHGIIEYEPMLYNQITEMEDVAPDISIDLMERYGVIDDIQQECIDNDEEDFIDEMIRENVEYCLYATDLEGTEENLLIAQNELRYDPDLFLAVHCELLDI